MRLDAFHLPGLSRPELVPLEYGTDPARRIELSMPQLVPDDLERQIVALLDARRQHLAERPISKIIATIDAVGHRILDDGDELRRTAITSVGAVTGMSAPMTRLVLDGMARDWLEDALRLAVRAEFPEPRALDEFVADPAARRRARAFGPPLIVHIFSGNVPGVSVTSLIRALLVKSASLGKTAAGEPVLAPLFARAIAEIDPGLGACIAVTHWRGDDGSLEPVALRRADAVIAYGGVAAIESLRARTPSDTPFHAYRHRVSFGIISREALTHTSADDLAASAALALATFDQQGCVSPHLFYVEDAGEISAEDWAARLARAMRSLERSLPRGRIGPAESAVIGQLRGRTEIAELAGGGQRLHASAPGTEWTVIFDPDPAFEASCLNRVVRVKPVASIGDVPELIGPLGMIIQTVGVAGPRDRIRALANSLGRLGATRITSIARMPWPPASWHHDGQPTLASLVRWCDWEQG
jgi:hypothetical protein